MARGDDIRIDFRGLDKIAKKISAKKFVSVPATKAMNRITDIYESEIRNEAPSKSGATRDSVSVSIKTKKGIFTEAVIRVSSPGLKFLLSGTGVFGPSGSPIRARSAQVLKFFGEDGVAIFRHQVRGMKKNDFVARGAASARRKSKRLIKKMAKDIENMWRTGRGR